MISRITANMLDENIADTEALIAACEDGQRKTALEGHLNNLRAKRDVEVLDF